MSNLVKALGLVLVALGAAGPALAGAPALCRPGEIPVFACRFKNHDVALCGSRNYSATTGYVQYRSRRNGRVDLIFPSRLAPAARRFLFSTSQSGEQHIRFSTGGFDYYLFDIATGVPFGREGHRKLFAMNGIVVRQGGRTVSQSVCDGGGASSFDHRAYTNLATEPFDEDVVRVPTR